MREKVNNVVYPPNTGKLKYAPYVLKLIESIQRGPKDNDFKFNEEELERVAEIGLKISKQILEKAEAKHKADQKFSTLIFAIGKHNPMLRK